MTPVVFFSHSSLDNDRAEALVAALEATGAMKTTFDVRDLRHGEEYAAQLYKWIARCHGAVLLLTANVMKRAPWVLQEATILRARSVLEGKEFRLFVIADAEVLDDPVWKTWFAPLNLDALQRLKVVDPAEPLQRIVDAVVAGMKDAGQHKSDFFSLYAVALAVPLGELIHRRDDTLGLLADGLQIDDADWARIVGPEHTLPTLFAQRLCQGDFGKFDTIDGLFERLARSPKPARQELLAVLRSYWVPLHHASRLADALALLCEPKTPDELPHNIVLLQTDYAKPSKVAEMHHERQFLPYDRPGVWVEAGGGNESKSGLLEMVRLALQQKLYPDEPGMSLEVLIAERAKAFKRGRFTFVHIAAPATAAHLLPVARRFWPCLFVLTVPSARCAELARLLNTPAIALRAEATPDIEHLRAISVAESHANK